MRYASAMLVQLACTAFLLHAWQDAPTDLHRAGHAVSGAVEAYSGSCTAYLDEQGNPKASELFMPSGKTIQLGTPTAIANAGQVNAFSNLDVRGMRSETDLTDSAPAIPDAGRGEPRRLTSTVSAS